MTDDRPTPTSDTLAVQRIRTMIRGMRPDQVPILNAEEVAGIVGEPLPSQPPR